MLTIDETGDEYRSIIKMTSMVNTMSVHQDRASHKESQQGKKIAKAQHGWGKFMIEELILKS